MLGSGVVYSGIVLTVAALALFLKPIRWLGVSTRARALLVVATGVTLFAVGCFLPVSESRVEIAQTRLDQFAPVWQFHEIHSRRIAASPARVFDAIKRVRADEIALFETLTWIRRGGRESPPNILNAGNREPILNIAMKSGFVLLADDSPRELVIGTVVVAPAGMRGTLTPEVFLKPLPPGFALAAMNFLVSSHGADASLVSTETRVFANDAASRRRFAAYWRVIYPGSAIIRRMWLRAIERRSL